LRVYEKSFATDDVANYVSGLLIILKLPEMWFVCEKSSLILVLTFVFKQ